MRKSIRSALIFCFLVFLPFQNTALQEYAGVLFSSPAVFFLFGILILDLAGFSIAVRYLYFSIFVCVYWVAIGFYYSFTDQIDFVFDRGIRYLILWGGYVYAYFLGEKLSDHDFRKVAPVWMMILVAALLLSIFSPEFLDQQSPLHYTENLNMRPRGFASESSVFGMQIFLMFMCVSQNLKFLKKISFPVLVLIASILVLFSQSKGASLTILVTVWVVIFMSKASFFIKTLVVGVSVGVALYLFSDFFLLVEELAYADIDDATSIATRGTMAILSISSLGTVFGVGPFGFLPYIYDSGFDAMLTANKILPSGLNYVEVTDYFVRGETKSVGAKTVFFDWIIAFGLPFVVFYFYFFSKLVMLARQSRDLFSFSIIVFVWIASLTYVSNFGDYMVPVMLGYYTAKIKSRKESA